VDENGIVRLYYSLIPRRRKDRERRASRVEMRERKAASLRLHRVAGQAQFGTESR
jgi:hypothetical protein